VPLLSKPVSHVSLAQSIRKVLDGEELLPSERSPGRSAGDGAKLACA